MVSFRSAPTRDLQIDYRSPLARSQKLQDLQSIDQFEARLVQSAQYSPQVLDLYDTDRAMRMKASLLGVDPQLVKPDQEVKRARAERAKAQQQQAIAQMQMTAQAAAGGQNAAPTSPAQ